MLQPFRNRLFQWLAPPMPQQDQEYEQQIRSLIDAIWIGSIPVFGLLPIFFWWTNFTEGLWSILHALGYLIAILLLLRFSGNLIWLAHLIAVSVFNTFTLMAMLTGGIDSPILVLYSMMIPVVYDLAGAKIGMIWSGLYVGLLLGFGAIDLWVFSFPDPYGLAISYPFLFVATIGILIYHGLYDHAWTRSRERLWEELKQNQQLLMQQDKMASLGQLTAGIAHEINNPTSFISANAHVLGLDFAELLPSLKQLDNEAIREQFPDFLEVVAEMEEAIAGIQRGTHRIQTIVSGLRTFTHSAKGPPRPEDLRELIETALILLKQKLAGIDIQREYQPLPLVACRGGEISQVLLNLIDNAAQAMKGEGTLTLKLSRTEAGVLIEVKDTGEGMSITVQQQAFHPFFTTKEVGKGTGLGLSISYRIVEQHGGTLSIQSERHVGTTLRMELPLVPPEREPS
jgi:signal transduction histidine kinase